MFYQHYNSELPYIHENKFNLQKLKNKFINTFAAKRDCSRIYCALPNATTVEILRYSW